MASTEPAYPPKGPGRPAASDRHARKREFVVGLVCAAVCAVFGVLAQQIKTSGLAGTGVGPSFFPTLLPVVGTGLSLAYCVAVLVSPPSDLDDAESSEEGPASVARPAAVLGAPLVWSLVLPVAGYLISTWAMLTAMLLLFDGRRGSWLLAPVIVAGVLWLVFAAGLKVDLPRIGLP